MNSRTPFLYAACVLAATVVISGCGSRDSASKTTSKAKPAGTAQAKSAPASQSGTQCPTGALPASGMTGIGGLLDPSTNSPAANPFALGANTPAKPGPALAIGKPAPIPVAPLSPSARPQGKQLLLLVQNAYRSARTMTVQGVSTVTIKQDGKVVVSVPSEKFGTTYKQPGMFILTNPEGTMSCDGKTVSRYFSAAKRYKTLPFDKDIARGLVYSKPGVGMMGLVFGMDYSQAVASYKLLNDAKVSGQDTFVLQLHFKKGVAGMPNTDLTQTLWIGKRDLAIYKNSVLAIDRPKAPKGYTGKVPKVIETTIVGTISKCVSNTNISDSAFAFKPPAGAKVAKDLPNSPNSPNAPGPPKPIDLRGKPAPDFTYTATDGATKKLSDLKGKPVVLIFWALPMPKGQLDALKSTCGIDSSKAEIVTINLNRNTSEVKSYLSGKGYSMPFISANESIAKAAMQGYALQGLPSMLIIDKAGLVQLGTIGIPGAKDLSAKLQKYAPAD